MHDSDAQTEVEEYVAGRNDEQVLSCFSISKEALKQLSARFKHEAKPLRGRMHDLRRQILEAMTAGGLECLQMDPGALVRKVERPGCGRKLAPAVLASVLDSLADEPGALEALAEDVLRERLERLRAWEARQAKAKKPQAAPVDAVVKGRARRKPTPLSRPMTAAELAAEALFLAVRRVHRPLKATLIMTKTAGRGKDAAKVTLLADAGEELAAMATGFARTGADFREHQRAIMSERRQHRLLLALCKPRLVRYIGELDPGTRTVKRAFASQAGVCTFTLKLVERSRKPKTVTLWDVSEELDWCASEALKGVEMAAEAAPVAASLRERLHALRDAFLPRVLALMDSREKVTTCVSARRTSARAEKRARAEDAAGGGGDEDVVEDEEDGEDEDDDSDVSARRTSTRAGKRARAEEAAGGGGDEDVAEDEEDEDDNSDGEGGDAEDENLEEL